MADPILRLATRATSRTRATAWGIAFACMVLVGALSLVDGLQAGVDGVASRIDIAPAIYASGEDLLGSRIQPGDLVGVGFDYAALRVHVGRLEVNGLGLDVVVATWSVHPDGDPEGTVTFPEGLNDLSVDVGLRAAIEERSGRPLEATGNLTFLGLPEPLPLPIVDPPESRPALLPDGWAWVRPELLVAANATEGGPIQALVTEEPIDPGLAASLGLRRIDLGAIGFARASVAEAGRALTSLAVLLVLVIGLIVYHGMSLEVHQRASEIRALRSLGAGPRTVAAVYEGQALALAAFGATMGSALGILAAHGIVAFAPFLGLPNLVILGPPITAVGLAYAIAVLGAAAGGLVPSRRAARVVRGFREARPS